MLAHGANAKAPLGPVQNKPHDHGSDKAEKHRDVEVEARERRVAKARGVNELGQRVDHGRHCRAIKHAAACKERDAGCQQVDCHARDGLVGVEGNGRHRMEQGNQPARQARTEKANPGVARDVASRNPGKRADVHHALDADVRDAGTLGDNAAEGAKDKGRGVHEGNGEDEHKVIEHRHQPPSSR